MEKHQFGNPVKCAECGRLVDSVWAGSWQEASDGKGVCDDDYAAQVKAAIKNKKGKTPEETKDDNAS